MGKLCVVILVLIGIAWIPIVEAAQGSELWQYIQSIVSYLAPPITAIYVLGIVSERINEKVILISF
jgi:hypothetical protein